LKTKIPQDYSTRIKATRQKLGLTQVRLAELMGVSFASVNRWENEQARPSTLAWRKIERVEMLGYNALLEDPLQEIRIESVEQTSTGVSANSNKNFFDNTVPVETELSMVPNSTKSGARSLLSGVEISFGYESGDEKITMTGLYVRDMLIRGLIGRVIIIAPEITLGSWEHAMSTHFNLRFKLITNIDQGKGNPFKSDDSDLVIASLDLLADDSVFSLLQESDVKPYDIAILDEAHSVISRNGSNQPLRSVRRQQVADALAGVYMRDKRWQLPWRARHLLLLSARMQGHFVD
jgi:transcriptional regulator with XRE-family HTH domain